ncbi:cyclase family protein [Pseudonocardia acaciae]|uniref:cyclase family protein n=1 Tax=Pseudonocardia acaciae TaxID=551276 RepID=UPI00048D457A|nr:cyclase family protein [Pseudonocardia acaciae]
MTQYRASFDAVINFGNGGDLVVHGFRVDVPSPDVSEAEIAALFVTSLGLLMTENVELGNVEIFAEPHKGTRGGPADRSAGPLGAGGRLVELSHVIRAGMVTYPGLPGPEISSHLTREASREHYAEGTEFAIDRLSLVGNTGTYLDSPYHRYPDGPDLSTISLDRVVDLPAVVVRTTGARGRGIDVGAVAALGDDVRGAAVLLHTGDSARFGTPEYAEDHHFLTGDAAAWLAERGPALVGIDAVNIDDTRGGDRPAHSLLLAAGIPVVEHLTGLDQLPPAGARFTAVPLRVAGLGTVPVRAFARLPV